MRIKSSVCVFVALLFLFGQIYGSSASSTNNFSFQSAGVTIDLTFPEEAHPTESITHNLTITAQTSLTLENFTIIIKVLVNSSWQQVYKEQVLSRDMLQNEKITSQPRFTLPQNADYTTHVRTLTYNELLTEYNELLTNYSDALAEYETLLESYNELTATTARILQRAHSYLWHLELNIQLAPQRIQCPAIELQFTEFPLPQPPSNLQFTSIQLLFTGSEL